MADQKVKFGIVKTRGWWLGYGWRHGYMLGWPTIIQRAIVGTWNKIICFLRGHDTILLGMPDIPPMEQVCPQCSKLLFGTEKSND